LGLRVSLSLRLKDLLGPVTRVKKKKKKGVSGRRGRAEAQQHKLTQVLFLRGGFQVLGFTLFCLCLRGFYVYV